MFHGTYGCDITCMRRCHKLLWKLSWLVLEGSVLVERIVWTDVDVAVWPFANEANTWWSVAVVTEGLARVSSSSSPKAPSSSPTPTSYVTSVWIERWIKSLLRIFIEINLGGSFSYCFNIR